jgi:hypothetical protein
MVGTYRDKTKQDYDREYYLNNKDQIKKKSKEYYQKNISKYRQQLECINCGGVYTINSKYKHFQSKKHLQSLQKELMKEIEKFENDEDNFITELLSS